MSLLTNNSSVCRRNHFLGTGGQLHPGFLRFGVVRDNSSIVAGSAGQLSAVARLLLQAADDGALGHGADGQDIADVQLSCREQTQSTPSFTRAAGQHADHSSVSRAAPCHKHFRSNRQRHVPVAELKPKFQHSALKKKKKKNEKSYTRRLRSPKEICWVKATGNYCFVKARSCTLPS